MQTKFHVYRQTKSGLIYYDYCEATLKQIYGSIKHDPWQPKEKCPGIVLNRFKANAKGYVRNRYANLDFTTGYYAVDVDSCGKLASLVKKQLFSVPEILICWQSINGGVKAIGYTPTLANLSPERFKHVYAIHLIQVRRQSGMKLNFDPAMGRCHQPLFVNSDPNALNRIYEVTKNKSTRKT
jgi:hypothetical protein